jgi:hypothetical protein
MRYPSFYIAGYPKSGTTALYHYLKSHPGVFLSAIKEPHYFSADLPGLREVTKPGDYYALYAGKASNLLGGDASASVIHSEVALTKILEHTPEAKFVVILREPVSAVRSFHAELLYNLNENVAEFKNAWGLQDDRAAGRFIPAECKEPKVLQYRDIFKYREQMPRFFDLVPPEQRLVLIFEEFFADPSSGYRRVLDFLGLPDDGRTSFENVNGPKDLRLRWLSALHRRLINNKGPLFKAAKRALGAVGIHPSHMLSSLNVKKSGKPQLSPHFVAELRQCFEPDVRAVEALLGRPIEAWKT